MINQLNARSQDHDQHFLYPLNHQLSRINKSVRRRNASQFWERIHENFFVAYKNI